MNSVKILLPLQPFVVKLIGLASGKTEFDWEVGREFFARFGNEEILDAGISVNATVVNHGVTLDVECAIEGTVTVPCDRCLDPLTLPVETGFEDTYVPEDDSLDLSQDVYDFVCTALPLQRVHENEEDCNQETLKYLSK